MGIMASSDEAPINAHDPSINRENEAKEIKPEMIEMKKK